MFLVGKVLGGFFLIFQLYSFEAMYCYYHITYPLYLYIYICLYKAAQLMVNYYTSKSHL